MDIFPAQNMLEKSPLLKKNVKNTDSVFMTAVFCEFL